MNRTLITGRGSPTGKLSDALTAKYTIGKDLGSSFHLLSLANAFVNAS